MQPVNDQRFYRSRDRILGGVCAGLAEGLHVDALWVRLAFLVVIFIQGVGLFLYVVLWLVMPERLEGGGQRSGFDAMTADMRRIWGELLHQLSGTPQPTSTAPGSPPTATGTATDPPQPASTAPAAQTGVSQNQGLIFGLILVVIGLAFLGSNVGIINWSVVWPAALITLGIVILVRNLERRP
jgi:phage shock protein PspC (stress-responsive transcriptional regulator)